MVDVVEISKKVLDRLIQMNYELCEWRSNEQLIFPMKKQAKGKINRLSEQELRQLFIEEFKKLHQDLYYSIETPTIKKYRFRDTNKSAQVKRQSALLDMCVFEKVDNNFKRKLNIEFKYGNGAAENTAKDIEKLVCEEENGVFIHLLKNTRRNTLCNNKETGVFDKLYQSFSEKNKSWSSIDKSIHVVIISITQKTLICYTIKKETDLKAVFGILNMNKNINEIETKLS